MTRLPRATDASRPYGALVRQLLGDLIFIHVLYNGAAPPP
jgi:hypothetical protein